ncbi:hypothetical protein ASR47_100629 [Janthinobacterium psychrotolerans]|uniref:Uncharacterized protein n=1 Tax=Janthinobacterium psychrotolerans TaxID=1747903 RepID=A0A1A7C294_9BURK|nr:hypothetical protein ASR47_100629 [Janthinobacterium psychrotolerans]
MGHRNGNFAFVALVVSSLALATMVFSDAYSQAAQAEASGYSALTHEVGGTLLCVNDMAVAPVVAQ